VEVAIAALGGGSDGLVVSVEEASLDDDPSLEPPELVLGAGGLELGSVGVVVVVVVVDGVVHVGEVPEVALESEPDDVDGVVLAAGLVGVVPSGQLRGEVGEVNVGAGPKKATRSVEMLVGSPRVTWATNTRGVAVEALGPSSQTAVPR
jgi:hypothetical protein